MQTQICQYLRMLNANSALCGSARTRVVDTADTKYVGVTDATTRTHKDKNVGAGGSSAELFGQFDHEDIRIIPQTIEHNLFAVCRDVEVLHLKARLQFGELTLFSCAQIDTIEVLFAELPAEDLSAMNTVMQTSSGTSRATHYTFKSWNRG